MAETTGTTRPTRRRATPKDTTPADAPVAAPKTPARTRATKAADTTAAPVVVDEDGRENYVFDLEHTRDTKTFAVFSPPKSSGCVGSLYMPLGTRAVRVRMTGGPAA